MVDEKIVVEIDVERVREAVCNCLRHRDMDRLDEMVHEEIRTRVGKIMCEKTREIIDAEIRRVVRDGWQETDQFGRAKPKMVCAAELIRQTLVENVGGYQKEEKRIDRVVREAVDAAIKSGLDEEMVAARKRFADAIDAVLKAKVADTLRKALGL